MKDYIRVKLSTHEKQIDKYVFDYKVGFLGKGVQGTVFKGYNIMNEQKVAIKIIRKSKIEDRDDEIQLCQEIYILESLVSPNVVKLYDVLQTNNNYYIIMELCNLGDLWNAIESKSIDSSMHHKILIDVLTGYMALIAQGIIHRDLKPQNIMMGRSGGEVVFKLADFGFAKQLNSYRREMLNSKVGTPLYMSPQLLGSDSYTSKSDLWSLAIVLYQVIYNTTPWVGRTEGELLSRISTQPLVFPSKPNIPDLAKDFIRACLQVEEKDRFSWEQVYRHPYVADNFKTYINYNEQMESKATNLIMHLRSKVSTCGIYQLFKDLDRSGDRALQIQEFSELMMKLDRDLEKREIQTIFDLIDTDGNGDIDFMEFKRALIDVNNINFFGVNMSKQFLQGEQTTFKSIIYDKIHSDKVYQVLVKFVNALNKYKVNLYQLFSKYDKSGNGSLDRNELYDLFNKVDPTITYADIDMILALFDQNRDNEIQFCEFKEVLDILQKEISFNSRQSNINSEYKQQQSQLIKQNQSQMIQIQPGICIIPMLISSKKNFEQQ